MVLVLSDNPIIRLSLYTRRDILAYELNDRARIGRSRAGAHVIIAGRRCIEARDKPDDYGPKTCVTND